MNTKSINESPLTIENTEKDALIRSLLNALLEAHDLLTCGWIEPRSIHLTVQIAEDALRTAKQSGFIKSADWPEFVTKSK